MLLAEVEIGRRASFDSGPDCHFARYFPQIHLGAWGLLQERRVHFLSEMGLEFVPRTDLAWVDSPAHRVPARMVLAHMAFSEKKETME